MQRMDVRAVKNEDDFIKLWYHECRRVFMDRLVNLENREFFQDSIKLIISKKFNKNLGDLSKSDSLLFCNFCPIIIPEGSKKPAKNLYQEIADLPLLKQSLIESLSQFNEKSNTKINLVLFFEAVENILKAV